MWFRIIALLAASFLAGSAIAETESPLRELPDYLPPEVDRILAEGEFELLSIDPTLLTNKQRRRVGAKLFHGYRVLGRVKIGKGPQRDELLRALRQAVANSPASYVYCFEPRHAIRASAGNLKAELLICFACNRIEIYSAKDARASTNGTAQPVLDAVLKRAGIPLAKH